MTISEILKTPVIPFEIEDEKLKRLFSFYFSSAPTIDSKASANIPEERLDKNWSDFISQFNEREEYKYLDSQDSVSKKLSKYKLNNEAVVNRKTHAFICKYRKDKPEKEYACLLRHIRNAIAHSGVYVSNVGNRKYIIFEDVNIKCNLNPKPLTARILLSQTDLARLKKEIMK